MRIFLVRLNLAMVAGKVDGYKVVSCVHHSALKTWRLPLDPPSICRGKSEARLKNLPSLSLDGSVYCYTESALSWRRVFTTTLGGI